jgi:predicted DNA-binding antitoxin AbrB/MazE fold protein
MAEGTRCLVFLLHYNSGSVTISPLSRFKDFAAWPGIGDVSDSGLQCVDPDEGWTMKTIHAIYENGVFRPIGTVELPEHSEVEFEPRLVSEELKSRSRRKIYDILSKSFDTSEMDLAARHDEHHP